MKIRLQKYLSAAGVCSRREAEERIRAGRVRVNGRIAALGESVEAGDDVVTLDGATLELPAEHTYIMLHKPRGYVTTLSDERGRRTVAELTADAGKRLYPVGRLDYDSEGLLILTDDGETANRLMHPSHGVEKIYEVSVEGAEIAAGVEKLRTPLSDGSVTYRPARAEILQQQGSRARLRLTISEGKKREIRRMCALADLRLLRLRRVAQGELHLGELPVGKWRYLTEEEIHFLHNLR